MANEMVGDVSHPRGWVTLAVPEGGWHQEGHETKISIFL